MLFPLKDKNLGIKVLGDLSKVQLHCARVPLVSLGTMFPRIFFLVWLQVRVGQKSTLCVIWKEEMKQQSDSQTMSRCSRQRYSLFPACSFFYSASRLPSPSQQWPQNHHQMLDCTTPGNTATLKQQLSLVLPLRSSTSGAGRV